MKVFPFTGNEEYVYDKTTNILHFCKNLSDNCMISHLTPTNSYLIPRLKDKPELTVFIKEGQMPTRCPHCFEE